jgi:hypothetical protein
MKVDRERSLGGGATVGASSAGLTSNRTRGAALHLQSHRAVREGRTQSGCRSLWFRFVRQSGI